MVSLQEIGIRYAQNIICYGSFNVLVNTAVASGTRFMSHIPTQARGPAAIAGAIYTLSCATCVEFLYDKSVFNHIQSYFLKSSNSNEEERKKAYDRTITICKIIHLTIATLATVIITPIVAKGLISHKEAFAFALINDFSTMALTKLFFS